MNQSSDAIKHVKVCLVHDWLVTMRGGEKVLEAIAEILPNAPIYTLFYKREALSPILRQRKIKTSFLQWIPNIEKVYRWLLPLFPLAIRSFNLKKFDLVISSSHCAAKGARARKDALHVCYCHTPMRYLWEFHDEYFGDFPKPLWWLIQRFFAWLRKWDFDTSQRVNAFLANSTNTARKIQRIYGRHAVVVHPPLDVGCHAKDLRNKTGRHYLIVSALVPYKRIELAIDAFNQLDRPLRIVGDGPERRALEKLVKSKVITFDGWLPQDALCRCYQDAHALIFPGEEDFGIVPLEAHAHGRPVIGYGKGGLLETVIPFNDPYESRPIDKSTGLFFYEQSAASLIKAVEHFERLHFDPEFIRNHSLQFERKQFAEKIKTFLTDLPPLKRRLF